MIQLSSSPCTCTGGCRGGTWRGCPYHQDATKSDSRLAYKFFQENLIGQHTLGPKYPWTKVSLDKSILGEVLQSQSHSYYCSCQVGADSGRHTWYKWRNGPTPEGDRTTQAINLFDLLLLSVDSGFATPDFHWKEPKPCSEKGTRVLGIEQSALKDLDF